MCATCGCGEGRRLLKINEDLLAKNRRLAEENRRQLRERRTPALNLVSSPGAGKTTLLERTIRDLGGRLPIAVIEGDQATSRDADRIVAAGAPAVQINTGKGCHLDAHMVARAVGELRPEAGTLLFIENVGNLVCPADFDLGEMRRVVLLSVAEGDDKPLKYPNIFASSDLLVLTKIDLAPHVDFDREACVTRARRLKPALEVREVSAKTGEGLDRWYDWLSGLVSAATRGLRDARAD
jgi:hydrogenase nickel incorporation protein HypB